MNAPKERGQESYKKVQLVVLMDEIMSGTASETTFAMMRVVSEHLPEKARELWLDVEKISNELDDKNYDTSSLTDTEKAKIAELRSALQHSIVELTQFIDTFVGFLDPEVITELSEAIANQDVAFVDSVLERCADAKERMESRIEE